MQPLPGLPPRGGPERPLEREQRSRAGRRSGHGKQLVSLEPVNPIRGAYEDVAFVRSDCFEWSLRRYLQADLLEVDPITNGSPQRLFLRRGLAGEQADQHEKGRGQRQSMRTHFRALPFYAAMSSS